MGLPPSYQRHRRRRHLRLVPPLFSSFHLFWRSPRLISALPFSDSDFSGMLIPTAGFQSRASSFLSRRAPQVHQHKVAPLFIKEVIFPLFSVLPSVSCRLKKKKKKKRGKKRHATLGKEAFQGDCYCKRPRPPSHKSSFPTEAAAVWEHLLAAAPRQEVKSHPLFLSAADCGAADVAAGLHGGGRRPEEGRRAAAGGGPGPLGRPEAQDVPTGRPGRQGEPGGDTHTSR